MAITSKTQLLTDIQTALKKHYNISPPSEKLSVIEAVIYGICREGTTRHAAEKVISDFKSEFFDWNEVRVSTIEELQVVFKHFPDSEARANRLRRFLRQLFEKTYSFNLDALIKKPQKEALKTLSEYEALSSDFVLAVVIRFALGGHAIPIDVPARRALGRLGVDEGAVDDATLRATLERAIPKTRGGEFIDLLEALVHDTCLEIAPQCPRCELRKMCPYPKLLAENPALPAKKATPTPATKVVKAKSESNSPPPLPPVEKTPSAPPKSAVPKTPKPKSSK